jgi:lipopolysaccharide transport system ATP-binding protein
VNDVAVSVRGLGKRYRIAHDREPYARLTETLWNSVRHPFRRGPDAEEFWALREVTFDVTRGDVVGIIGRNGAGKSTLLKILSRITEPTEGEAVLHGRVSSLLEVGTGFHPELTGRENIFLSGSVLGMRRAEIRRRFDEIVAFAEVDRFLDTPVKRYSSGMQVRLGFAVAAHLEPDILVVDEVLAVGDAAFQKKCLAKMQDVAYGGRTVLFVSHNMSAVLRLCTSALLLDQGRIVASDATPAVVRRYLESDIGRGGERRWDDPRRAPGDDVARLRSVRVLPAGGGSPEEIDIRSPIDIEVEYRSESPGALRPFANLHLYNDDGVCLFITSDMANREWWTTPRQPGIVRSTVRIPGNFLAEGRVIVTVAVSTINPTTIHAIERDAVAFQVVDRSEGDGVRGEFVNDFPGVIRPMLDWTITTVSNPD